MTTVVRVADRLVTFFAAAALLVAGAWLIGYRTNVPVAREASALLDADAFASAPQWPWWPAALGVGGVVAALLGLWLVLLHVRPRSIRTVTGAAGAVDLDRLADAVADDLGRHPAVQRAKAVTRTERGRPVMRITAEVASHTPAEDVHRLARRCRADARRAAGTDFEFQLLIKQVRPEQTRSRVI
ncbi:hypothetical protein H7J87_24240 [Mycolicibacterium wolinskyi]|uniref:Alkaline shock response membrane anchor protein AmaP n=1 Tax=Mycolicibacterium wolinskyi TaxID=59750 RepID=A0A1X2EZU4_9MYCO|nr:MULTISPECIES: hypothetical protein [Mycolicibacterium]MCV7288439.1 hypothetical protein [Mycolicibacterium wolinskyi]MCV7295661.1 hypothetical protein [Mycolicibacterium goodii]ORX11685.1 hypothetical protein AWC31_33945 [Mycolicibacterium wolinskyi]